MLLLDFGNSAIKGQWWLNDELQSSFSCRLDGNWQANLKSVLPNVVAAVEATQCYFASVADPDSEAQLLNCLKAVTGLEDYVRLTTLTTAGGVHNGYTDPDMLGVDRWLALLGANDLSVSVDKLIIDAGSAITVDLLTKDGHHLGGAILPGFNTSIARFKKIMSKANFDHPDIVHTEEPGYSTEACIHINCSSSVMSMVDELIDSWFKRLAPDAVMIVTGGDAKQINSNQQHPRYEIPNLVFRGMRKQLDSQQ
ncbi:MAG: type III pantothenate kinase [Flavobacteriales bacterium]|jgi:type III pantothenate kinase